MKTLKQMLKEIGYNDSPLREEVINTFKMWIQQKRSELKNKILSDDDLSLINSYIQNELLEKLNQ